MAQNPSHQVEVLRALVAGAPGNPAAWHNFGMALVAEADKTGEYGELSEAERAFRRALKLDSRLAPSWSGLSMALARMGRLEPAFSASHKAFRLMPRDAGIRRNHALLLYRMGENGEAVHLVRGLLTEAPGDPSLHWNLAQMLLMAGEYAEGWREYEWRSRRPGVKYAAFPGQEWDGTKLDGTLFVHCEQGFGDSIEFIRFARLARERCKHLILAAPPPLARLFSGVSGVDEIVPFEKGLPPYDAQIRLLSLPHVLGVTLENLPADIPYLPLPPPMPLPESPRPRIGVIYTTRKVPYPERAIPEPEMARFSRRLGVPLFVLARDCPVADENRDALVSLAGSIGDFRDMASAMRAMDAIVSVDTAGAHLAGAMGCKTFLLLPHHGEWRWLLQRGDSPWYPGMRILRQEKPGDWREVLDRLLSILKNRD